MVEVVDSAIGVVVTEVEVDEADDGVHDEAAQNPTRRNGSQSPNLADL